jgi:hypothetical protein
MSVLPFSVETFGPSQALADEVHIPLGRGEVPPRILLECMQAPDCHAGQRFLNEGFWRGQTHG